MSEQPWLVPSEFSVSKKKMKALNEWADKQLAKSKFNPYYHSYKACLKGENAKKRLEPKYAVNIFKKCQKEKYKRIFALDSGTKDQVEFYQNKRAKKEARIETLMQEVDQITEDILRWLN